jgi:hypothetical protein
MKTKIAFLHIPKTAGTSLVQALSGFYAPDERCFAYGLENPFFVQSIENHLQSTSFVTGHFQFLDHLKPLHSFEIITFLRDPVARLLSHYNFIRSTPTHPMHRKLKLLSFDFKKFAYNSEFLNYKNYYTRLFSGITSDPLDHIALEKAIHNFIENISFVGFTESYEQSLHDLSQCFKLQRIDYIHENTTSHRFLSSNDSSLREFTQDFMSLDYKFLDTIQKHSANINEKTMLRLAELDPILPLTTSDVMDKFQKGSMRRIDYSIDSVGIAMHAITIGGWAIDLETKMAPKGIFLHDASQIFGATIPLYERKDIKEFYNVHRANNEFDISFGFIIRIPLATMCSVDRSTLSLSFVTKFPCELFTIDFTF